MEIEFNPNRITGSPATQPVAKSVAPAAQPDSASLGKTEALKSAINNIPLVRPEKVDAARAADFILELSAGGHVIIHRLPDCGKCLTGFSSTIDTMPATNPWTNPTGKSPPKPRRPVN